MSALSVSDTHDTYFPETECGVSRRGNQTPGVGTKAHQKPAGNRKRKLLDFVLSHCRWKEDLREARQTAPDDAGQRCTFSSSTPPISFSMFRRSSVGSASM